MKQYALLVWLLMAFVMPLRARAGEAPPPAEKLGDNAALKYWIAFDLMSKLTPEQSEIAAHWDDTPINGAAFAVVAASENTLRMFHEGARLPRCDWGVVNEGPATEQPYLARARALARLACLRVRYRASKGEGEGAVQDMLDVFALSRHFNRDAFLISHLLQLAIQHIATSAAADSLKRLNPDQLKKLGVGLDVLPAAKDFREAILSERDEMLGWLIDYLKRNGVAASEKSKEVLLEDVEFPDVLPKGKWTRETVDGLICEFEKAREYYTQWAEIGALRLAEFDRRAKLIEERRKKECPIAGFLFAPLPGTRYAEARAQTRTAMLKAAIAVILDGPDRLKDFKDPFGDGPFEYIPVGKGFILKSKLLVNDTAVGLTVPGAD